MRKNKYKTQIKAVKSANLGRKFTKNHKAKIRKSMKCAVRGYIIIATRDGESLRFQSMAECARKIGCTRQLVSQCIKRSEVFHSARGWKIKAVKA